MSTSRQLMVTEVRSLQSASYTGLRVSLKVDGITARDLLTGDLGGRPLVGIVRQRGRARDLVGTYWAGVYLVSEYFRRSLAEIGATGWFTTPVRVEKVPSPLWLLSIAGTCGPLFGVGGEPLAGGPRIGTFLDGAQWDGSDFFLADNNNSIFVVGSTAERIQQLRLSNVALESAGLEPLSTA